jgi:hypothetical protein
MRKVTTASVAVPVTLLLLCFCASYSNASQIRAASLSTVGCNSPAFGVKRLPSYQCCGGFVCPLDGGMCCSGSNTCCPKGSICAASPAGQQQRCIAGPDHKIVNGTILRKDNGKNLASPDVPGNVIISGQQPDPLGKCDCPTLPKCCGNEPMPTDRPKCCPPAPVCMCGKGKIDPRGPVTPPKQQQQQQQQQQQKPAQAQSNNDNNNKNNNNNNNNNTPNNKPVNKSGGFEATNLAASGPRIASTPLATGNANANTTAKTPTVVPAVQGAIDDSPHAVLGHLHRMHSPCACPPCIKTPCLPCACDLRNPDGTKHGSRIVKTLGVNNAHIVIHDAGAAPSKDPVYDGKKFQVYVDEDGNADAPEKATLPEPKKAPKRDPRYARIVQKLKSKLHVAEEKNRATLLRDIQAARKRLSRHMRK